MAESRGVIVKGVALEDARAFGANSEHVSVSVHLGGRNVAEVVAFGEKGKPGKGFGPLSAIKAGQAVDLPVRVSARESRVTFAYAG